MKTLCEELNAMIPCKTPQDSSSLWEKIHKMETEGKALYWETKFLFDCKCNLPKMKERLVNGDGVKFFPTENQDTNPGIIVKYEK